jgi:hypothetical protein
MAETYKGINETGTSSKPNPSVAALAQSVADQARSAGRDIKDKAADLAGASSEALKGHVADLTDAAKDVASQAGDKVQQVVNEQRGAGAEYVGNLANTLRRAAREFEPDIPIAATYIRKAASQVETVSETVRAGNFKEIVRNAQSFARRQPTAFLGLSVLAGFGVIRFLKSSADQNDNNRTSDAGANQASPNLASTANSNRRSTAGSQSEGYRDDFTQ